MNKNIDDIERLDFETILRTAIDFDGLSEEEQQTIVEEVGELVWRNALLCFMNEQSDEVGEAFVAKIESLSDTDQALQILEEEFPEFTTIFKDELSKVHDDMTQVVDALGS